MEDLKRTYQCTRCGQEFDVRERRFRCDCGGVLDLRSRFHFRREKIHSGEFSMWRYRHALPIEEERAIVSLGEGMTPLVPVEIGGISPLAKMEWVSPTASFKDRGASVLVSFMKEAGIEAFVEDSSGNAGAALSAYAARAGIRCEIYTPETASSGKIALIEQFGARLHRIPGSRADTARAVLRAAEQIYYGSHNWNPFFLEGLKTIAFEIIEQLRWNPPDAVVMPLGYGGLLTGVYRGFREMWEAGAIPRIPRILGVQAQNCSPLYRAFRQGLVRPEPYVQEAPTLAEGIAGESSIRGELILKIVRETGGVITAVSEKEIRDGIRKLHQQGMLVEPTSAVVVPAVEHWLREGVLQEEETVVVILTGSGLKTLPELQELRRPSFPESEGDSPGD